MIVNMSCWFFPVIIAGIGATFDCFRYEPNLDMCLLYDDSFTNYYGGDADETTWIRAINNYLDNSEDIYTSSGIP
jgi:hypothetical protein